jgi:propanol-preferring alcohol dehydrogenase
VKSMVLSRPAPMETSPLVLETRGDLVPGEGELLLRVSACGVCRTDLQICEGDLAARVLPVVPGHQIVGHVERTGPGVIGWSVGQRAGIGWLASACGACAQCRMGRENLCPHARFTGWDKDGGYATHAIVRADFAFALPDGKDDLSLAPLLCGGVIGYRSLKRSGIEPGGVLGLFGFGASALLTIQVARHWGCRVFVCTRTRTSQESRCGMGRRLRRCGAGTARCRGFLRTERRRSHRSAARDRARRHRRDQRHSPRSHPIILLRPLMVGAEPGERRKLHAPGRS